VLLRSLRFQNFKALRDFTVRLHRLNVLVGPNNAGKSTILDGLRAAAAAIKFGRRRNATLVSVRGQAVWGYEIPTSLIPISLANIHSDYQDVETTVTLALEMGSRICLGFYNNSRCVMTLDEEGAPRAADNSGGPGFDLSAQPVESRVLPSRKRPPSVAADWR
jgi:hypothetical protein